MAGWLAPTAAARAARQTLRRFPFVLLAAATATAAGWILVDRGSERALFALLFSSLLGLPLFVALKLLAEREGWGTAVRTAARLGAIAVLVGFYFGWLGWSEQMAATRFVQLAVAFHLLVAVLPYVRRGELEGFWQYNRILFLRFLTAGVYSGVLFAGLSVALAAIDNLLGVGIAEETYVRLWIGIAFLFNTWFFLAGVPADLAELQRRVDYPRGLKIFAQFILVPLVTTYLIILTLYLGKVLWTRAWPSGWIGYLVSSVAAVGILSLLLVHPVRERAENRWIATYARGFFLAILPAVVMLLMAIGKRIGQYGITENRYFLVLLALWLGGTAIFYTITRSRNIKVIPGTLAVLAFLAFAGPWSAYAVSERSQRGRLAELLEEHGVLERGRVHAATTEVPFEDRREISGALRYLVEMHGTASLESWFDLPLAELDTIAAGTRPAETSSEARRRAVLLMDHLGLAYVGPRMSPAEETSFALHSELESGRSRIAVPIAGHDYAFRLLTWPPDSLRLSPRSGRLPPDSVRSEGERYDLAYDPGRGELTLLREGEAQVSVRMGPLVERGRAYAAANPGRTYLPSELLRAEAESDRARMTVYLEFLAGRWEGDSLHVTGARGQLYLSLLGGR